MAAIRQVAGGQSTPATDKVLGIPKASLSNWVRQNVMGVDVGGEEGMQTKQQASHPSKWSWRGCVQRWRSCIWSATSQKKPWPPLTGHAARYAWIYQMRKQYPVRISCELLEFSTSGYFIWQRRRGTDNAQGLLGATAKRLCWPACEPSTPRSRADTAGHACTTSCWRAASVWVKTECAS